MEGDNQGLNFGKKKKKRTKPAGQSSSSSFKWTTEIHMNMANYFKDNYEKYKSTERGAKVKFLKVMKERLGVKCTDTQFKNGFNSFLKKYQDIRHKLNQSGFGIDPEVDKTLESGWIKKQCPYFDLLDEVLSSRPNIIPPAVVQSTAHGEIGADSYPIGIEDDEPSDFDHQQYQENVLEEDNFRAGEDSEDIQDILAAENELVQNTASEKVYDTISATLTGLGVAKKRPAGSKTALGAFSEIIASEQSSQAAVEEKKLKLEAEKFEHKKQQSDAKLQLQLKKVDKQLELDSRKFDISTDIELKKLQDAKDHRQFEIEKLEKQHEFELRKLELQIALEKAKRS